jgi:ribosomal protein S18 acetylase RimI-like enzyme
MTARQSPAGLAIRPAHLDEADAVADLHTASWRVTYRGILPDDTTAPDFIAKRREYWRAALARDDWNFTLVAEEAGVADLIGFVATWGDPDGVSDAFIESLHVRPGRTRGGIGRALIGAAAAQVAASGRRSLSLWVYDANTPAKEFYRRIGGSVVEKRVWERAGAMVCDLRILWPDAAALAAACANGSK